MAFVDALTTVPVSYDTVRRQVLRWIICLLFGGVSATLSLESYVAATSHAL